jgi:uncharacterized membrane protein
VDCVDEYIVITVHPEWNTIFFARKDGTIIAYDMDRIKVHVIPAHVFLGFISRAVNKAAFDVSLCDAFQMDQCCLLVYGHVNFLNDGCCHYFS